MHDKKIIAVVGATGAQGGGLVRAILDDPDGEFGVRVLSRDVQSGQVQALARRGAETAAADLDDGPGLERALQGAYGAFFVTFYWAHGSPEREQAQAGNMARAARGAGIRHAVWSTLEDTRHWIPLDDPRMPTLMGQYKVPHFDAKGASDRFFRSAGVPTTFLLTSFFWENFITLDLGPQRGPDGGLVLTLPMGDAKLPGIAARDIGRCALGIFRQGERHLGRTLGICGDQLTGAEMALALTRALGQEVRYDAVDPAQYRRLGLPGAEELGNMFQFKRDFADTYCGARSTGTARALNPGLETFDAWLARNRERLPG
jgi:uncharacterized protein YbjT (DUF2867 family)